jgi:hypothetical protein
LPNATKDFCLEPNWATGKPPAVNDWTRCAEAGQVKEKEPAIWVTAFVFRTTAANGRSPLSPMTGKGTQATATNDGWRIFEILSYARPKAGLNGRRVLRFAGPHRALPEPGFELHLI